MNILDREISVSTSNILKQIYSQISLPIKYTYIDKETSSCESYEDYYLISIMNNLPQQEFEDHLLHESCHLLQFQNHYPMIKLPVSMDKNDRVILENIQEIVLDLEIDQKLKEYGYHQIKDSTKYNKYKPLIKQIKKEHGKMPESLINESSLEIAFIMISDSKPHAEELLSYLDVATLQIRKNVYAIVDILKHYIQSGINKDNIPLIYSTLNARLSDLPMLIENI